jgi:endonuclease YncB( thermonuclease family)
MARERTQHGRLLRVGCILTTVGGIIIGLSACSSTPDTTADGTVQRVVDSETLEVTIDGKPQEIRLQNIATPAGEDNGGTPNCLEPEANGFVRGWSRQTPPSVSNSKPRRRISRARLWQLST